MSEAQIDPLTASEKVAQLKPQVIKDVCWLLHTTDTQSLSEQIHNLDQADTAWLFLRHKTFFKAVLLEKVLCSGWLLEDFGLHLEKLLDGTEPMTGSTLRELVYKTLSIVLRGK